MKNLSKCICKECFSIGRWRPYITVRIPENDNVFEIVPDMPLCDKHKREFGLDDVIPDSSMKQLQAMFSAKFIHPPKKENMSLEWKAITIEIVDSLGRVLGETEVKNDAIIG